MTLFTTGIPIIYYGTEQAYSGGNDPANRESLWPNFNTSHELYLFIQRLVEARKKYAVGLQTQVQRYASDNFYSFSRDSVLVCLTNTGGSTITISMPYLPYTVGEVICNVLDSNDCLTVQSSGINVVMTGGLPKIYVPK